MNNNFVGQMPMQPAPQPQNLPQGQLLNNVVLVPDIDNTDWYPISPGGRVLFLNNAMTCFKLQCRDQNGFPGQERRWKMEDGRDRHATSTEWNGDQTGIRQSFS